MMSDTSSLSLDACWSVEVDSMALTISTNIFHATFVQSVFAGMILKCGYGITDTNDLWKLVFGKLLSVIPIIIYIYV